MKIGIYIGRFCTFHNGHLSVIQTSIKEVDHLIVIIGSTQEFGTWKNIFDADTRKQLILYCLKHSDKFNNKDLNKLSIVYLDDTETNEEWILRVSEIIDTEAKHLNINNYDKIFYCGEKDLNNYPSWFNCEVRTCGEGPSSTDIRRAFIRGLKGDIVAKCFAIENLPSGSESELRLFFQKHPEKIKEWENL